MHIYFCGINGAGLAPLALLTQDCGLEVTGSDGADSLNTNILTTRGIQVSLHQTTDGIAEVHHQHPIDWLIYSAAVPAHNPERQFAQQANIRESKRHELINYILHEKKLKLLAVAGTHGKTTTTAMLVWLFRQLQLPVSHLIGTNISFGPAAEYQPGSEYLVLECDEFDRNFLFFEPAISLLTSVDYDHSDTYPTVANYRQAFSQFMLQTHNWGCAWKDQVEVLNIHAQESKFEQMDKTSPIIQNYLHQIQLPGQHNRENALLAIQTLQYALKSDFQFLVASIATFPGTQRRFERLAENLYTDYAHHPTEISATLQLALEINPKVVVVYQPHQNTRQHESRTQTGYQTCFAGAHQVYWLPTYLSRENPALALLTPASLSENVHTASVTICDMDHSLILNIKNHLQHGHLVLVLGAGSVDGWARINLIPPLLSVK